MTLDGKTRNVNFDHMTKKDLRIRVREIKRAIAGGNSGESGSGWNYLCNGKMSGGCIVFGGWLKVIPKDGSKYAYCAFGGLGVSGWDCECSIYSTCESLDKLYSSAVSCMIVSGASLPDDPAPGAATDCVFYDSGSHIVGIASSDTGVLAWVGGTVKWKNK